MPTMIVGELVVGELANHPPKFVPRIKDHIFDVA